MWFSKKESPFFFFPNQMANAMVLSNIPWKLQVVLLWIHESERIYGDRLVSPSLGLAYEVDTDNTYHP